MDVNLERLNIAAVRLLANTTHKLQPCHRKTSKVFQQEIRRTRDLLLNMSHFSWANTSVKIKLAVAAHKALTPDIARASFCEAGLWPMDFRFMSFLDDEGRRKSSIEPKGSHARQSGMWQYTSNSNVSQRVASIRLMKNIHSLTNGQFFAHALEEVSVALNNAYVLGKYSKENMPAKKPHT